MEPCLLAHFMGADVPSEFLDELGNAGVTTVSLFASLGGGETEFRQFLARPGIDIVAADLASSVLQARIVAAWKTAQTMQTVQVQSQAQRSLANLPPEISLEEMDQHSQVFAASPGGFPLSPITTPSKGYFESKVLEVQSSFKAEPWTTVTNLAQETAHRSRPAQSQSDLLSWDSANSGFRLQQESFGFAMPSSSEGFRMRLRLWGLSFAFLKQRFPQKASLQSANIGHFDRYQELLYGPQVMLKQANRNNIL